MYNTIDIKNLINTDAIMLPVYHRHSINLIDVKQIYVKTFDRYYVVRTNKDIIFNCAPGSLIVTVKQSDNSYLFKNMSIENLQKGDLILHMTNNELVEIEELIVEDILVVSKKVKMYSYARFPVLIDKMVFIKGYHTMPIYYLENEADDIRLFDILEHENKKIINENEQVKKLKKMLT